LLQEFFGDFRVVCEFLEGGLDQFAILGEELLKFILGERGDLIEDFI
jgi:hypothetical protein